MVESRRRVISDSRWSFVVARYGEIQGVQGSYVLLIPGVFNLLFSTSLPFDHSHNQFLIFAALSAVLVLGVLSSGGCLSQLMKSSFVRFRRKMSFSAYLWHMLLPQLLKGWDYPSSPVSFVGFLGLVALVAQISSVQVSFQLSNGF